MFFSSAVVPLNDGIVCPYAVRQHSEMANMLITFFILSWLNKFKSLSYINESTKKILGARCKTFSLKIHTFSLQQNSMPKVSPLFLFLIILHFSCKEVDKKQPANSLNLSPVIHLQDTSGFDPNWSKSNTIVSHLNAEPDNLHPSNGGSSPRSEILIQTQAFLLITDFENQTIAPGLVTALPTISSDGLSLSYTLREDPQWDNGERLTVQDVIFTAKAQKCELTNNPSVKAYWKNIQTILPDDKDPQKFTMIMKENNIQNMSFVTSFCIMQRSFHDPDNILNKYSFEQLDDSNFHAENEKELLQWAQNFNDDKYGRTPEYLNGLGPYKVSNWETGQSVTLIKKKNHWTSNSSESRLSALPDKIIYKVNKDENSVQLEFKTQTLDVSTNLSMGTFTALASNPAVSTNYHHVLSLTYNYTFLCFNEKPESPKRQKLFTDKQVRRAFALLTPVENLTRVVYKEYSTFCKRMISNVSPLKPEFNSSLDAIKLDIDSAAKLLHEAGWRDTDADGILDKQIDGSVIPFKVELAYLNSSPDWKDMAMLISESYAKAGIKTDLLPVDLRVFLEKARQHDFDMILGSWGGTPFPEDFTQLWHSKSWLNNGSNYSGFGNAESDALIDSIKTEINSVSRRGMIMRFQEMIYDDQPYVFLFCSMRRNLIHKRFGNISVFADRPGLLLNTFRLLSTTAE